MDYRYWEDFRPGAMVEFGAYRVTEEEMLEFARRYDPQPFHTDPEAARHTHFGGLIASGWHTLAMLTRMVVDELLNEAAALGSPGVDEVRWLKPVRPGDVLSVRTRVVDAVPSTSKPDRGVVRSFTEVLNQEREVVLTLRGMTLMLRRTPGGG